MTPRKHEVASLSGAYVLDSLDAESARLFEAHLLESEETRNETTELSDTAVLLGLAVDPVTPPASLKASILAQIEVTEQLPREVQTASSIDLDRFSAKAKGLAQSKAQARWFTRPVTALVAVAAAAALIVGGGVVVNTLGTQASQQAQADQLAAINAAGDSQRLVTEISGGGTATLMWSGELKSSALIVDGLDPLPADKVYELWYINDGGARPAGTFTVNADSSTWRVLEGDMKSGDIVGVTVEPAGGSKVPTTDPVIKIQSA